MTILGVLVTVLLVAAFGAFVLFGAWIDGRRQKVLEAGEHPVTKASGEVVARETEEGS